MTAAELRKRFLEFFRSRGHAIVPSSSLLPGDDPSVLLTTAGMQQFKAYYTGDRDPLADPHPGWGKPLDSFRTASIQKSFRTSDIDEVGDESHLTFFEMLGNFSFGYPSKPDSYFKKEAIEWGWEFITSELKVDPLRTYVTVFGGDGEVPFDQESYAIWRSLGIPEEKIERHGRDENFWGPTGDQGPCGPTTEMYVDGIEVWNLVFNEFSCHSDKRLEPLKEKGVDTGMGLERLALVMQFRGQAGEKTIFDTDLFAPIIAELRGVANQSIGESDSFSRLYSPGAALSAEVERLGQAAKRMRAERVVADHLRAAVFLIADGVRPSNKEAGYILRRLLRRAIVNASVLLKIDVEIGIEQKLADAVVDRYGTDYPELKTEAKTVHEELAKEKAQFLKTLDSGLKEFERILGAKSGPRGFDLPIMVSGQDGFRVSSTYGFPIEMMRDLAEDRGFTVDEKGFQEEVDKHREISRAGVEKKFGGHGITVGDLTAANEAELALKTRLHTATHLLHQALRDVLGPHVEQRGSDITAERLRFDFSHPQKLMTEELKRVEEIVNEKIREDLPVTKTEMALEEALKSGAHAFFKTKYPERVNVYSIENPSPGSAGSPQAGSGQVYSKELCGGPHIDRTGEIGIFKIVKEEAVSVGVRRIRATVQ